MKKPFSVLKGRERVLIRLTRDSVCAGDDCDAPHEYTREIYAFLDPVALVTELSANYLPLVSGIGHSWECLLNGKIVATIDSEGIKSGTHVVAYAQENSVHFRYYSSR